MLLVLHTHLYLSVFIFCIRVVLVLSLNILELQCVVMNAFSVFALFLICQQGQMPTLSSLPVGSPLAQPGSAGGAGSGSSVGSLGPNSISGVPPASTPTQSINLPHCPPVHQNSPSPAHSRTPTPTPGSQTPQPHTPSLPQLATTGSQQQLPPSTTSDNVMQPQQQSLGGGTPPGVSHSGLSTPNGSQHPRTPVSTTPLYNTKILGPHL